MVVPELRFPKERLSRDGPRRNGLAASAFAAWALYLDAFGFKLRRAARYSYLQYAVLKSGAYLALLNVVRQNEAPPEGTVATLPYVVAGAFPLLLRSALATYGE